MLAFDFHLVNNKIFLISMEKIFEVYNNTFAIFIWVYLWSNGNMSRINAKIMVASRN